MSLARTGPNSHLACADGSSRCDLWVCEASLPCTLHAQPHTSHSARSTCAKCSISLCSPQTPQRQVTPTAQETSAQRNEMKGPGKCGHFLQLLEQSPTDEAKAIEVYPLESEAGVRRQGGDRATSPQRPREVPQPPSSFWKVLGWFSTALMSPQQPPCVSAHSHDGCGPTDSGVTSLLTTSARPCFQTRPHAEAAGLRTSTFEFGGCS